MSILNSNSSHRLHTLTTPLYFIAKTDLSNEFTISHTFKSIERNTREQDIMRHRRSSFSRGHRHGSFGRRHSGLHHTRPGISASRHHSHIFRRRHHGYKGAGSRGYRSTGGIYIARGTGSGAGRVVGIAIGIPFLVIGIVFIIVGISGLSWSMGFAMSFFGTGGLFFILGLLFLIVGLVSRRPHKIWWDALSREQRDHYISFEDDIKTLHGMYLAGKLPEMHSGEPVPEECPNEDMDERDYPPPPPQLKKDYPPPPPVWIRNIGKYIDGSEVGIKDSVVRRSSVTGNDEPVIRQLQDKTKEDVLSDYEEILRETWSDGKISEIQKKILDHIRERDEITMEDHRRLENKVIMDLALE